jgi:hypothetical protein
MHDMSLHKRNLVTLQSARDIFGFSKGRSWASFKSTIAREQIREFYEVQAALWPPTTDWAGIMPTPDGKLRGLYLGDIRPQLTLRNIVRFSLYSDSIVVINPFPNPHIIRPEYNPIDNPEQYKADTINLIHFLFSVSDWIEKGIVLLVPDPGDLKVAFKWETARLAKARLDGWWKPDERDLEEARELGHEELKRVLFALPEDKLFAQFERAGMTLDDRQKREFLAYARRELRNDPIALEQPIADNYREGQMVPLRAGTNLETALLICSTTGAFPYTNLHSVWAQIIKAHDDLSETARMWSPLTKAFQSLDFRFLDNVDPKFAQAVRDDGRLQSFRSLLRKIGDGAADISELSSLDAFVRDCNDELVGEYQKAQAEWSKIDESFLKWASGGIAFAMGHLVPDVSALSVGTVSTIAQLGLRYFRQRQFRKLNPMSVMIDLARKETPGTTLY